MPQWAVRVRKQACFTMCPKATLVLDVEPSTYNILALSQGQQGKGVVGFPKRMGWL